MCNAEGGGRLRQRRKAEAAADSETIATVEDEAELEAGKRRPGGREAWHAWERGFGSGDRSGRRTTRLHRLSLSAQARWQCVRPMAAGTGQRCVCERADIGQGYPDSSTVHLRPRGAVRVSLPQPLYMSSPPATASLFPAGCVPPASSSLPHRYDL
ncbi:hypothetical protein GY45DRAFT_64987 [Cubamyces sp. BRFM 1775]|nr:hypothetical protein GY45DRAFT_64987 [Cubamyces sp. BRFM 1775]